MIIKILAAIRLSDHPVYCKIHDGIDSTILIFKHHLKAIETRPEVKVIKDYG
ncbi:MAG: hypothetical protein V7K81_31965 [Nostoc sp.]